MSAGVTSETITIARILSRLEKYQDLVDGSEPHIFCESVQFRECKSRNIKKHQPGMQQREPNA